MTWNNLHTPSPSPSPPPDTTSLKKKEFRLTNDSQTSDISYKAAITTDTDNKSDIDMMKTCLKQDLTTTNFPLKLRMYSHKTELSSYMGFDG